MLNSFLDIPWGSSLEYAKEKMLKKDGIKLENDSNDTILFFTGGSEKIFNKTVKSYDLSFVNKQLYSGSINFLPEYLDEVLPMYLELKNILIREYGEPNIENETVDAFKNSMNDLYNLRDGKGQMQSTWDFPVSDSKWKNAVILILMKGSDIGVMYLNSGLYVSYLERKNKNQITP